MNAIDLCRAASHDSAGWRSVYDRLLDQAQATPKRIAVETDTDTISYAELVGRAYACAARIEPYLSDGDRLVALCLDRDVDLPAWLVAIFALGGAYMPIDPSLPPARIAAMLDDARPALIVASKALTDRLPDTDVRTMTADAPIKAVIPDRPLPGPDADDLAYMIYTSGSTGAPKGVEIQHRALCTLIDASRPGADHPMSDALKVLAMTRLSFDISVADLFVPLATGGSVVILSADAMGDPAQVAAAIERHRPSLVQATPAFWRAMIEWGWSGASWLTIHSGGEALTRDLADALLPRCAALWNCYGPTEATVWATTWRVMPGDDAISIGTALDGYGMRVVDAKLHAVPDGEVGELCVSGPALARGYRDRAALSEDRFVVAPDEARLYRTGDLGFRGANGLLYCRGRQDDQVKIRGFRIELGDVEAALCTHDAIGWSAARRWVDATGEGVLVGYIVPRDGEALDAAALRAFLADILPEYMIPARLVFLDVMPLSANGKIDRAALPEPQDAVAEPQATTGDTTRDRLAAIWREVLAVPQVHPGDDFFDLGGYSLITIRLALRIEETFGIRFEIGDLMRASTLDAMARSIEMGTPADNSIMPLNGTSGRAPLYWIDAGPLIRRVTRVMPDQPVLSLNLNRDDRAAFGEDAPIQVAAVAAKLRQRLTAHAPHGPYNLAGWCRWGVVAHELACQLREAGETVALLVLLDADPHNGASRSRMMRRLKSWRRPAIDADDTSFGARIDRAATRHVPRRLDVPVCLIRPQLGTGRRDEGGWRRYVTGDLTVVQSAGDHETMVRPPHADTLGAVISDVLRDASA